MSSTKDELIGGKFWREEIVFYVNKNKGRSFYVVKGREGAKVIVQQLTWDGDEGKKKFSCDSRLLEKVWLQPGDRIMDKQSAKMGIIKKMASLSTAGDMHTPAFMVQYDDRSMDYVTYEQAATRLDFAPPKKILF